MEITKPSSTFVVNLTLELTKEQQDEIYIYGKTRGIAGLSPALSLLCRESILTFLANHGEKLKEIGKNDIHC